MTSTTPAHSTLSADYQQRFGGIVRLYGTQAALKLQASHSLIIGLGGVGSWAAEALARSGVGQLSLMDMDDICVTNTNRQAHTLAHTIGQSKTAVMAKRLLDIHPALQLHTIEDFIDKGNLSQHITTAYTLVIDAIDSAIDKTELIAFCTKAKLPIISVGSSGGKSDPSQITFGDLKDTTGDPLFAKIRNNLRRYHGFSRDINQRFGIEAIYSTEQRRFPDGQGEICTHKRGQQVNQRLGNQKLDCNGGYGACTMVTASFGLLAAARAVESIIFTATGNGPHRAFA